MLELTQMAIPARPSASPPNKGQKNHSKEWFFFALICIASGSKMSAHLLRLLKYRFQEGTDEYKKSGATYLHLLHRLVCIGLFSYREVPQPYPYFFALPH